MQVSVKTKVSLKPLNFFYEYTLLQINPDEILDIFQVKLKNILFRK